MPTEPLRYRFAARPLPLLFAVCFFGGAAGLFAHLFGNSDRPVRVLFFLLEGDTAKAFFAVLGLCSLGFVSVGVWNGIRDVLQPRELVIDDEALSLQLGVFRRTRHRIRLDDIEWVGHTQIYSNRFLVIRHAGGTLQFPRNHLPNAAAVDAVVARLRDALGANAVEPPRGRG